MPRYVVERTFAHDLRIPVNGQGAQVCGEVIANNTKKIPKRSATATASVRDETPSFENAAAKW